MNLEDIHAIIQAAQVDHLLPLVAVKFIRHHRNAKRIGNANCGFGQFCRQGVVHRSPCCGGVGLDGDTHAHGLAQVFLREGASCHQKDVVLYLIQFGVQLEQICQKFALE